VRIGHFAAGVQYLRSPAAGRASSPLPHHQEVSVHRARFSSFAVVTLGAVAIASFVNGCSGASNNPSPQITAPARGGSTPTPGPVLALSPPSMSFPKGKPGQQQVTIVAPNPSNNNIAIVSDSCTGRGIATAQSSPPASPSPTPAPQNAVYVISSGANDGSCAFMFQDMVSLAKAPLNIVNSSHGGGGPSPSPTPIPTPTMTGSPQAGITFIPPSITFAPGQKSGAQVTADYPPSQYDQNTQIISNNCGNPPNEKADITKGFDYGIWQIVPGPVNGDCNFTIEDLSNPLVQGTMFITNNSN
jgi:hypothetical protein